MDITEKIDILRRFPDQAAALIDGMSEAQLTARPLPGEWSVAQNIHHCADAHMNGFIRLKLILSEDNPPLKPYDQEIWAEMPDSTNPDMATSLALLRGLHARWTLLFASLSDDQWTRTGYHPGYGSITTDGLLDIYVDHCRAHLDQIERTIAAGR